MNETVKMIDYWEMAACKVQSYKPGVNKIKSKLNNKTNSVCKDHCNRKIQKRRNLS